MAWRTSGAEEGSGVDATGASEPSRKETNSPLPSAALGKTPLCSVCISLRQRGQDVLEF